MTEIEKIGEESFINFDPKNISKVPHVAGVIELADIQRDVVYLDSSPDLNKRLFELLNSFDPCLQVVKFFRIAINPNVEEGLLKAFYQYKENNDNKIPRCCKADPTRRIK